MAESESFLPSLQKQCVHMHTAGEFSLLPNMFRCTSSSDSQKKRGEKRVPEKKKSLSVNEFMLLSLLEYILNCADGGGEEESPRVLKEMQRERVILIGISLAPITCLLLIIVYLFGDHKIYGLFRHTFYVCSPAIRLAVVSSTDNFAWNLQLGKKSNTKKNIHLSSLFSFSSYLLFMR
jgi:hypothetical protein